MRDGPRSFRCPHCWSPISGRQGRPVLPGHLVLCDGCLGLSTLDDEATRLMEPEPGTIDRETAADVARLQADIRGRYAESGGLPPGFVWRNSPVCGRCWREHTGKAQSMAGSEDGLHVSRCGVCGQSTLLAVVVRMLVPREGRTWA